MNSSAPAAARHRGFIGMTCLCVILAIGAGADRASQSSSDAIAPSVPPAPGTSSGPPRPTDVPVPAEDLELLPPLPDSIPLRVDPGRPGSGTSSGPLIPGQLIEPIDLVSTMRLVGARDLDIAIAKERVCQSLAELEQARVLWLPSLYLGPNWIRHDGQAQIVQGPVQTISKSSLFLGATAAAGSSISGPVPAGGPAQVSGLTTILRISDAIFEPLAARQVVTARRAGIQTATNDALLSVAETYIDLQAAAGKLAIAREAATNAEALATLTSTYARSGTGLEADHRRALAEQDRQRKNVEAAIGQLETTSAELVRQVRLDPRIVVAPVEPPETVIRLVNADDPLDELIAAGLRSRPELAEAHALVEATLTRLKQARLRPLIPSVALRYSGGGFGGGVNGFFGNFASRSDADVNLFWELQNLGFADRAIARQRAAQKRMSILELMKVQDRVAAEVVRADKERIAANRQLREAGRALPEALSSLSLNFTNIRRGAGLPGATRPIEVLQPIQALAQARSDYLDAVLAFNRAQFRLYHALGRPSTFSIAQARAPQLGPANAPATPPH